MTAAPLQALAEWAQQNGRGLAELCRHADRTPLVHSIPLQGPTGESNTLKFAPRAKCPASPMMRPRSFNCGGACDRQSCCTCRRIVDRYPVGYAAPGGARTDSDRSGTGSARPWPPWTPWPRCFIPVHPSTQVANELAARDGAGAADLVGRERYSRCYRLTVERVVTVNTTAAGGNATLMMLDA